MRTEAFKALAWMALGVVLAIGCSDRQVHEKVVVTPSGEVVTTETPPPPRSEMIGSPPGTSYVWAPGYWTYQNERWVWLPGHWDLRPRAGVNWIPGHWDKEPRGWVWTPGHWE